MLLPVELHSMLYIINNECTTTFRFSLRILCTSFLVQIGNWQLAAVVYIQSIGSMAAKPFVYLHPQILLFPVPVHSLLYRTAMNCVAQMFLRVSLRFMQSPPFWHLLFKCLCY